MFQVIVECISHFGMCRHPCRHGHSDAPEDFPPGRRNAQWSQRIWRNEKFIT
jgi:hypothetical protein